MGMDGFEFGWWPFESGPNRLDTLCSAVEKEEEGPMLVSKHPTDFLLTPQALPPMYQYRTRP